MFKLKSKTTDENGWFLVSVLVMTMFLTIVGVAIASLVAEEYQHSTLEQYTQNASLAAEAGIEQSVVQLNTNNTFAGYSSPQVYFNNTTQGYATFTTTITTSSDGKGKIIVSTANVYHSSSSTTPAATRSVKVTVVGTSSSGYSVLTGPGGLILGGSANITNSNVYVSGTISMSGGAQIGTDSNPVTVNVANDACPTGPSPGSTYPQVCTDGSQPISMTQNTAIYGSVCATGQTSTGPNNNIQTGNGGQGLIAGCTAPVSSPPTYDRLSQINAVTTTGTGTSNTYTCQTSPYDRNWPANLELTGDVSIGDSCNVTINGNVWITGNLTINGSANISVPDSLGTTTPVVMVDGTITVGGSATITPNSSGTGVEFISFDSTNSCTIGTTSTTYCSSLTGNDLKNSQSLNTISVQGGVNVPGSIFDAYWSEVTLAGSGTIGAATGQTVNMAGAGSVIFGTSLASNTQTWEITSYLPNYSP